MFRILASLPWKSDDVIVTTKLFLLKNWRNTYDLHLQMTNSVGDVIWCHYVWEAFNAFLIDGLSETQLGSLNLAIHLGISTLKYGHPNR